MMPSKDELVTVSVAHRALVDLKMKLCDHRCEICPFVSHTQGPGICTIHEPKERLQTLLHAYKAKQKKEAKA